MSRPSSTRWYGAGRNQFTESWKKRKAIRDEIYHERLQVIMKQKQPKHPSLIMYEYLQEVKHEDRSTEK